MINFSKVRNVKNPIRAHSSDAGIDFFIPDDLTEEDLLNSGNYNRANLKENIIDIFPNNRILIPSGIHVNLKNGWALVAFNKSGVSTKKGLIVGASVVDAGYTGEIHISLINTTSDIIKIKLGEKIIQFLYLPVGNDNLNEVKLNELYDKLTERGSTGFGKSGKF